MVFPSNYLDPTTHQWQQQQQQQTASHQSGSFQLVSPPGSMVDRTRMTNLSVPETALKCPRCESTNTKFCYFNNYSLSQPRHFCKTCRRYWTRGGALRSVPVGGGYRRNNKRPKSTSKSPVNSQCQQPTSTTTAAEVSLGEAMRLHYNQGAGDSTHPIGIANLLGFDQIQWRPQLPIHQTQPSSSSLATSSARFLGNSGVVDASSSYNIAGIQKKKMEEDGQQQVHLGKPFWGSSVVAGSDRHYYWSGAFNPSS